MAGLQFIVRKSQDKSSRKTSQDISKILPKSIQEIERILAPGDQTKPITSA